MFCTMVTTQELAALLVGFDALPDSALVNPQRAGAFLDVEVGTLANWRWKGGGPRFEKMRGSTRYRVGELRRWQKEKAM